MLAASTLGHLRVHTQRTFREHNMFKLRGWSSAPIVKLQTFRNGSTHQTRATTDSKTVDFQEPPHPPNSSNNRLKGTSFNTTLAKLAAKRFIAAMTHNTRQRFHSKKTAVVLAGDGERILAAHDMGDLTASPSRSGCWAVGGAGEGMQAVTLSHVGSGKTLPTQTPHNHELVTKRMMHK